MADADLQSAAVVGRPIRLADRLFGADQSENDASAGFRSDTLAEVIATIFQNPPSSLTPAQRLALRQLIVAALVAVNPTGAATARAQTINVDGTIYTLPDDVVDVTDTGLPALTADNYRQFFVDHDTPRVWVGHREIIAETDATGTFTQFTDADFIGVHTGAIQPDYPNRTGVYYYYMGGHSWFVSVTIRGNIRWRQTSFAALFPNADWLGEQADDATAVGLVDNFTATRQYMYYNPSSNQVRVLTNSTYTAATAREEHFVAEPISSPNVVGTITGITAGAGLEGGGSSGQVSLAIDEDAADFPVIPITKGGTGAASAAAARTALGLDALLAALAPLASPTFTGTPLTPTAQAGTNTTQIASTAFVSAAIAAALLSGGADGVLASAELQPDGVTLRLTLSDGTNIDVNLMNLISGLISGVTAGVGLTGGGTAGDISIDVDVTEADFPTIPVDKGGTGAVTAAAARAALGLAALNIQRDVANHVAEGLHDTDRFAVANQSASDDETQFLIASSVRDYMQIGAALLTGATFTGAASGIDPTDDANFVTLGYARTHFSGGMQPTNHTLYAGWSADAAVDATEAAAGTDSDTNIVTLPLDTGSQYLWIWRADADGGDPSEVHIAGGGNVRNTFGAASALTVGGVAGQLIVSVTTQNADLLGGETLRVV